MKADAFPKPGRIVVCQEQAVESLSLQGFSLQEVLYSDSVEYGSETTTESDNGYNNQYGQRSHTVTKSHVLRQPRFLMVQSADDTLARMAAELGVQRKRADECALEVREAHEATRQAEQRLKDVSDECERLQNGVSRERVRFEELRNVKERLERDMGKIRNAVGDLKLKEILGE